MWTRIINESMQKGVIMEQKDKDKRERINLDRREMLKTKDDVAATGTAIGDLPAAERPGSR